MKKPLVLLALALFVCVSAAAQRRAAWNVIDSINELEGFWEGSRVIAIPADKNKGLPKSSITMAITLNYQSGGELMIIAGINLSRFLDTIVALPEVRRDGITKDQFWEYMAGEVVIMNGAASYDDNYNIFYPISFPGVAEKLSAGEALMLNRDRTRLRIVLSEPLSLGMGDAGFKEMILDKKK